MCDNLNFDYKCKIVLQKSKLRLSHIRTHYFAKINKRFWTPLETLSRDQALGWMIWTNLLSLVTLTWENWCKLLYLDTMVKNIFALLKTLKYWFWITFRQIGVLNSKIDLTCLWCRKLTTDMRKHMQHHICCSTEYL